VVCIRERGILRPLRETVIKAPYLRRQSSLRLTKIVPDGTIVQKGDVVFEVDRERIEDWVQEEEGDLEVAKADYARRQATAARYLHSAQERVESARLSLKIAERELANAIAGLLTPKSEKIMAASDVKKMAIHVEDETKKLDVLEELQNAGVERKTELDHQKVEKRLAEIGKGKAHAVYRDVTSGPTPDELRQFELQAELARHTLRKAEKGLEDTKRRNARLLTYYQARIARAEKSLKRAQKALESTVIRSPASGMVLARTRYGQKLVPGMLLWRGYEVVSLPDLSRMKVQLFVEESRIPRVRVGQPVRVSVPALDDVTLKGTVSSVDGVPRDAADKLSSAELKRMARPERRVFEVAVRLAQSDPRLKPRLNVVAEIEVKRISNCLVVPYAAVMGSPGEYYVLEDRPEKPTRHDVTLRAVCDNWAAVKGDVRPGMQVLLTEL